MATPPGLASLDDEKQVRFEGADGQRRIYLRDEGTCAEVQDAGISDSALEAGP